MHTLPALVAVAVTAPAVNMPTMLWQVTPHYCESGTITREKDRAVVLVHGLIPRPVQMHKAAVPEPHSWQKPDSKMVCRLAPDFDVFGFSYAQTTPVDLVCWSKGLRDGVKKVKAAGYKEVVLVGHSAGGVVVYQFAEHFPDAGMNRVVVVAAPLHGARLANLPTFGLPPPQLPFIKSLAPDFRKAQCEACSKPIPEAVEVCCVVCKMPRLATDTIVAVRSQWPDVAQKQGIPAVLLEVNHFDGVRSARGAEMVAELAKGKLTRWDEAQVAQAKKALFGEE
jgi:pimeloyl-ACP methyl ester carboxylesterase